MYSLLDSAAPPPAPPPPPSGRKCVLIVDDFAPLLPLLSILVRNLGYDAVTALGGRAGLELARQRAFDFLLIDYDMPDLNGLQLIEALRQDERKRLIPAVIITGRPTTDLVRRAKEAGARAVLGKPLDSEGLRLTFQRHLRPE